MPRADDDRGVRSSAKGALDCDAKSAALAMSRVESRRILIVEDDDDLAESLSLLLEMAGHRVTVTCDGTSALTRAAEFHPEVVLCDLGLPGELSGHDVAAALRCDARLKSGYRVAISGRSSERDQQQARDSGFDAYLTKPVALKTLESLLRALPR